MIISADDRAHTVLAYSDKGHWDENDLPENLRVRNLASSFAAKRVTFDAVGATTTAHFPGSARWSGISSIVTPSNHAVPFAERTVPPTE